jgi:hypothetical protein
MSIIDLLKKHGAEFNGEKITITCRGISKVLDEYSHDGVIAELQDILDCHSTQAYYPSILRGRIKRYKPTCTKK